MAGIYLHIPFCRQKCHYCNFFSVASLHYRDEFLKALNHEIELQKHYLEGETIETIYFGGGTPSLLKGDEINEIFGEINKHYRVSSDAEITLEANPDDLDRDTLKMLCNSPVNRLSIGVQSFFDDDLNYLNRVHSSDQALEAVKKAREAGFQNISIDLIYGIPTLNEKKWLSNLETFYTLGITHLSAYALTVEPKTALDVMIRKNRMQAVDEQMMIRHFKLLMDFMKEKNYLHYEISNFCQGTFYSKHNRSYWSGEKYLGLGPSAHSFNKESRKWNISSISGYLKALEMKTIPADIEYLTIPQKYNEYIMTSLRTMWGADYSVIQEKFGEKIAQNFQDNIQKYILSKKIENTENAYFLTDEGKLFADGIAADLFL